LLQCLAFVAAATLQVVAFAAPLAMVTEVQGDGEVLQQGKRAPLQVRTLLNASDGLQLAEGGRVAIAVLSRGQVFHAYGPGVFRLEDDGLTAERGSRGRVEKRELAAAIRALAVDPGRNAQATIITRGDGPARGFAAVSPTGLQLEADARRLAWRAVDTNRSEDWKYQVVLSDDDGNVAYESTTRATELLVPANVTLMRGREYVFEVIATG